MEKERTHKMRINLASEVGNSTVQIFILLTISGISLANTLKDVDDYQETQKQLARAKKKFVSALFVSPRFNICIKMNLCY